LANGRRQIESRYPTQAKVRLEWGTQHLLPVWKKNLWCAQSVTPLRLFDHLFSRVGCLMQLGD
jgi:hypothetical protein